MFNRYDRAFQVLTDSNRGSGDLKNVIDNINGLLSTKYQDYIIDLGVDKMRLPRYLKKPLFRDLFTKVSTCALRYMEPQWSLLLHRDTNGPLPPCTRTFSTTLGLPCAHMMEQRLAHDGGVLKIEDIHSHWYLKSPEGDDTRIVPDSLPNVAPNNSQDAAAPNTSTNSIPDTAPDDAVANLTPNLTPNPTSNIVSNFIYGVLTNALTNALSNIQPDILANAFANVQPNILPNVQSNVLLNVLPDVDPDPNNQLNVQLNIQPDTNPDNQRDTQRTPNISGDPTIEITSGESSSDNEDDDVLRVAEPNVIKSKGRPRGALGKKRARFDSSTQREPSGFEYAMAPAAGTGRSRGGHRGRGRGRGGRGAISVSSSSDVRQSHRQRSTPAWQEGEQWALGSQYLAGTRLVRQ